MHRVTLDVNAYVWNLLHDLWTVRLECDTPKHDIFSDVAPPTASKKATSNVRFDGHVRKGFMGTLRL